MAHQSSCLARGGCLCLTGLLNHNPSSVPATGGQRPEKAIQAEMALCWVAAMAVDEVGSGPCRPFRSGAPLYLPDFLAAESPGTQTPSLVHWVKCSPDPDVLLQEGGPSSHEILRTRRPVHMETRGPCEGSLLREGERGPRMAHGTVAPGLQANDLAGAFVRPESRCVRSLPHRAQVCHCALKH